MAEFKKALASLKINRRGAKTKYDDLVADTKIQIFKRTVQEEIKAALQNLPFKEKKRILEAVFSPDAGGKIFIRPVTGADLVDDPENYSPEALNRPIKGEFQYTMDFQIDLNRAIGLINSLNNKDLLIKDDRKQTQRCVRFVF